MIFARSRAKTPGCTNLLTSPPSRAISRTIVAEMNTRDVDAVVLSACVQMPSLPVVSQVEAMTGKPVITAAVATTYAMLKALKLDPVVPGAGALLSGAY